MDMETETKQQLELVSADGVSVHVDRASMCRHSDIVRNLIEENVEGELSCIPLHFIERGDMLEWAVQFVRDGLGERYLRESTMHEDDFTPEDPQRKPTDPLDDGEMAYVGLVSRATDDNPALVEVPPTEYMTRISALMLTANYLGMRALVDVCCRATAHVLQSIQPTQLPEYLGIDREKLFTAGDLDQYGITDSDARNGIYTEYPFV